MLSFALTLSDPGYVSLFTIDANGVISPLYPDTDPSDVPGAMRLAQIGDQVLPGGAELDDTLGSETVVVVFSLKDFDRSQAHKAVANRVSKESAQAGSFELMLRSEESVMGSWIRFDKGLSVEGSK